MKYLTDPRSFPVLIMCLYLVTAVRWAVDGNWFQAWYWLSALSITAAVTWGPGLVHA